MGDSPFFGYSTKRGYRNVRNPTQSAYICSFIQRLNLQNSTVTQVIARIWHNARPWKVGILIWLTLNRGLPVGTWLQCMGILPTCKVCTEEAPESPQHCLLECRNPSFGLATKARGCKEGQESKGRKPGSKGKRIGRVRAKRTKLGSHHILPGV
jgi:hypothetical protein